MNEEVQKNSILKSGLKRKTLLLTGILMLAVIVIQFTLSLVFLNTALHQNIEYVENGFDTNIKTAVETLVSTLKANHRLYEEGIISEETAKEIAKKIIRDTRYSSGTPGQIDDGYFWADMADGYCVVHYNAANEGTMRWDAQDQEGTYFIRGFIRLGDEGGGYSDFYFGKPGHEEGSYKKRGYTLKFEPYGWYISTGNYYDDTAAVIADINRLNFINLSILFITSFITATIGLFLVSRNLNRVVQPIIKISARVRQLSLGDTSTKPLAITTEDEIGELHTSILRVVNTLHKLLNNIHTMISEHGSGNIDYRFDTQEFFGDFKVLAESVLELADFGMKDQLTGLPNRRGFDNRLEMEWQRAVREGTVISVFFIDVDHFKNYNDSFGHQQGDETLGVVAETIRRSVKRSIDFAARWGGEEFVVLLPSTDAAGALVVAEKVRVEIENVHIPCNDERGRRVTVSIGVSTQAPIPEDNINDLIAKADAALYRAKETGRNKVSAGDR